MESPRNTSSTGAAFDTSRRKLSCRNTHFGSRGTGFVAVLNKGAATTAGAFVATGKFVFVWAKAVSESNSATVKVNGDFMRERIIIHRPVATPKPEKV
jgi:hypothetical protein